MTKSTSHQINSLEMAIVAIENLETAGILFYGTGWDTIDSAKRVLDRELTEALFRDLEAEEVAEVTQ